VAGRENEGGGARGAAGGGAAGGVSAGRGAGAASGAGLGSRGGGGAPNGGPSAPDGRSGASERGGRGPGPPAWPRLLAPPQETAQRQEEGTAQGREGQVLLAWQARVRRTAALRRAAASKALRVRPEVSQYLAEVSPGIPCTGLPACDQDVHST